MHVVLLAITEGFAAVSSVVARACDAPRNRRKPVGPWYTPYIAAILASSACAVQMFEVAFSRLMCCSRV